MTRPEFNTRPLIITQQIAWYSTLVIFALTSIVYLFAPPSALKIAEGGVIFVLVATLAKLLVLSDQFRKNRLKKYLLLSALLVMVLVATIIVRLFE